MGHNDFKVLLTDYAFQPLPDLGSGVRDGPHERRIVTSSYDCAEDKLSIEVTLRAAYARLLMFYLDSRDFIFADYMDNQSWKTWRVQLEGVETWEQLLERVAVKTVAHVDDSRSLLDIKKEQCPFPAIFCWNLDSKMPFIENTVTMKCETNDLRHTLRLDFDSHLISEDAARVFLDQVIATVDLIRSDIGGHPNTTLNFPPHLLSSFEEPYDASRAELTVSWLSKNAKERPDAIAHEIYSTLSEPPVLLTYKELHERSNMLAHWLVNRGVKLDDKVAVCGIRNVDFYIAHAAIFKSGGCYVPIDPELPKERKTFIANNSDAVFVMTTRDQVDNFDSRTIILDSDEFRLEYAQEDASDICRAELDSLAYLLYTSGTTGTPKGCLLQHRGLFWAIEAMCIYPLKVTNPDTDKRLAMASIAFDVHISEICQSWCLGTRLVSGPRFEILANLQENIQNIGITHLGMVPSMIEATLTGPEDLPLKYLVSGGEKISDSLLKKWANHPKLILANFYGPTEATVGCTSRRITLIDRKENVGRPFSSVRVYVVDSSLNLVPRGTPGELVVEGPLVAAGYHKLPDATKKAFLEWPHEGCRSYRTGDLVKLMPDNTLEIMGRIDTQIKLRGVRIESEGVSSVLRASAPDGVSLDISTVISTHPGLGQTEQLVSFVAPEDSGGLSVTERRQNAPSVDVSAVGARVMSALKDGAEKELAVYMRPSYIVPVSFLPLNLNGKIDSKVLTKLFRETSIEELLHAQGGEECLDDGTVSLDATENAGEPNETESMIIVIVGELTGMDVKSLTPATNLFDCGLDSLKFAGFAQRLRREFNVTISVVDVMSRATIEAISSLISSSSSSASFSEQSSYCREFSDKWRPKAEHVFDAADIEAVLPPFPVQEGIIFQSLQNSEHYVQHFLYRCRPETDVGKMKAAWEKVMERQQILRTTFLVEDALVQVVLTPGVAQLPWSEYSISLDSSFEDWFHAGEAARISREIIQDLTSPLFSLNVYSIESDDIYLAASLNHALYDGNAAPKLIDEFEACYRGTELPPTVSLSSILDFIPPANDESVKRFWKEHFSGARVRRRSLKRPSGTTAIRLVQKFDVLLQDVQQKCSELRISIQAFMMVAFALTGRKCLGWGRRPVFGVIKNGRSLPPEGVEDAICPLVSVVPVHVDLSEVSTNSLLCSVQSSVSSMTPYEHSSLGHIQRYLGVKALIDVLFSCRYSNPRKSRDFMEYLSSTTPSPEFYFALELVLQPDEDSIEARSAFVASDISSDDVNGLLESLHGTIRYLISQNEIQSDSDDRLDSPTAFADSTESPAVIDEGLESKLAILIGEYLNTKPDLLNPTTSFMSLGLSSLRAVALSRHLSSHGQLFSANEIIQGDSIRAVIKARTSPVMSAEDNAKKVEEIQAALRKEFPEDELSLGPGDTVEVVPCTALQAGMLSQTLNSEGDLYVHAFTLRLLSDCDQDRLRSAWLRAVKHLSILRTSFHFGSGSGLWAQVVHSYDDFKWSEMNGGSIELAAKAFVSDLSFAEESDFRRPPTYFRLVKTNVGNALVVLMHHALYDGISVPMLFRYVRRIYFGDEPKPPLDFYLLSKHILQREIAGVEYWTDRLDHIEPYQFPRIKDASSTNAWRLSMDIDCDVCDVARTCRRYQVHPQTLGQVALAKVMAVRSSNPDVVFGQVTSGRILDNADEVIGPTFNTIPCRVSLNDQTINRGILQTVQKWNNDGLSYQHAPLRGIQKALRVTRLFDILFLYQPRMDQNKTEPSPIWELIGRGDDDVGMTQYAINIEVHELSNQFVIRASCSSAVFDRAELKALIDEFRAYFIELVRYPLRLSLPKSFMPNSSGPGSVLFQNGVQVTPKQKGTEDEEMASWTSMQQKLLEMVVEFTTAASGSVKPQTSLTSMGVDSISAVQIASMSRKEGLSLRASDVVRCTTISDLLTLVTSEPNATSDGSYGKRLLALKEWQARHNSDLSTHDQDGVESIFPVSSGMQWNIDGWFCSAQRSFRHAFVYHIPNLNSAALRGAWQTLVEQQPMLRSSLLLGDSDSRYKNILAVQCFTPPTVEEQTVPEGETDEGGYHSMAMKFINSSTSDCRSCPTRFGLIHGKLGSYMVLSLHHMQYDALSLRLLIEELTRLYRGEASSVTSNQVESFYSLHCRNSDILDQQEEYWKGRLGTKFKPRLLEPPRAIEKTVPRERLFSLLRLLYPWKISSSTSLRALFGSPLNFIRKAFFSWLSIPRTIFKLQGSRTPRLHLSFAPFSDQLLSLESIAERLGLSLQDVVLSCWALTQASFGRNIDFRQDGATFAVSHSGRTLDIDNIDIGSLAVPCYNILPLHVELSNYQSMDAKEIQDLIRLTAVAIKDELKHRSPIIEQTQISDVRRWVGVKEGFPLCNVYVNVVKLPRQGSEQGKETFVPMKLPHTPTSWYTVEYRKSMLKEHFSFSYECFFEIVFHRQSNSLYFTIESDELFMNEDTIKDLVHHWIELLKIALDLDT